MRAWWLVLILAGCAWAPTHKSDPRSCRERMAVKLAQVYTDPNNLHTALDSICGNDLPTTTLGEP